MNLKNGMTLVFLLVSLLIIHSSGEESVKTMDRDIEITLERGMCFGTCPVYSVSLFGNGTVLWKGEKYVAVMGNVTAHMVPHAIGHLYDQLITSGFLDLEDTYASYNVTDMPSATLIVRNGTHIKKVYHYHGDFSAPHVLNEMEETVDQVADTSRWIGVYKAQEGTWGESI